MIATYDFGRVCLQFPPQTRPPFAVLAGGKNHESHSENRSHRRCRTHLSSSSQFPSSSTPTLSARRLESDLTAALGRPVKVGNLSLSLLSGSVAADDISIADDPAFSQSPFVQAKSLKVGVELIPLIFSKTLNVTDLTLNQPEISLVKSAEWREVEFLQPGRK